MAGKRREIESSNGDDDSGEDEASPLKRPRMDDGPNGEDDTPAAMHDAEMILERSLVEDATIDLDALSSVESGSESGEDEVEKAEKEEANRRAYDALKKTQATQNRVMATKEAGYLKKIHLIDFMCHRNFSFDFVPKMNGISGNNGTLGGAPKATGRGHMKDLIRNGADKATVILTIANGGPDAMEPDKYGDEIIIERQITRSSSPYRVKTKEGRVIGQKKEDVGNIKSFFQIDVDSPLTILTQDLARGFLQSADEHQLYMLFSTGTGLQALMEEYGRIRNQIEFLLNTAKRGQNSLPETKDIIARCKRQLESSSKIKEQKAKEQYLKAESAWAFVNEKEDDLKQEQERKAELESKIEQANIKSQEAEKGKVATVAQVRRLEEEIAEMEKQRKPLQDAATKANRKIQMEEGHLRGCEADEHTIRKAADRSKETLNAQQIKIDKQISKMEAGPGQRRTQDQELLAKCEAFLRRAPTEEANLKDKIERAVKAKEEIERDLDDAGNQVEMASRTVEASTDLMRRMKENQKDRLAAFGTNVRAVLAAIEKTQWRGPKPVGPLGLYVRLENMQWREILQGVLGNWLCTWACQHPADSRTLLRLLEECDKRHDYRMPGGRHPNAVITNSADMFDFSGGDRSHLGVTVLSQLRFEGDHAEYVKRVLINKSKIEATFLASDASTANREIDRLIPQVRGSVTVLTANGYANEGFPDKTRSSQPAGKWQGPHIFIKDYAADIAALEERINNEKAEVGNAKAGVRDIKARLAEAEKQIEEWQTKAKKFKAAVKKMEKDREDAQERLAKEPADELSALEDVKRELQRELGDLEDQLRALEDEKAASRRKIAEHREELKTISVELRNHEPRMVQARTDLQTCTVEHARLQGASVHYTKAIEGYQLSLEAVNKTVQKADEVLQTAIAVARGRHEERIKTKRTWKKCSIEADALKKAYEQAEKAQGFNVEEVQRELNRAVFRHNLAERGIRELGALAKTANQALRWREEWWREIRRSHSIYATCGFANFLSKRNLEGQMELDHVNEKMYLRINTEVAGDNEPPAREEVEAGTQGTKKRLWRTPKSLSGGERSFCTVSLLLALWDCMDSPLCCLDEWDVFLDAANRKIAGNMLLECARDGTEKQFILISPQDVGTLQFGPAPLNQHKKMLDPERGQTTLPFQPVTAAAA